ncbi:nucleotidyltransferase family protein [Runella sp.]|uniref:nucleotidyltransferase family protein n=1 Tax=Runella sp. TaxID=1960881 RepID=UPI003D0B8E62
MTIVEAKKMLGIREDQIWLLKAALFAPPEAHHYWMLWKRHWQLENVTKEEAKYTVFINIDGDSQRILPLIYRNLEHTQDPLLPALRDAYRNTWMRNQKLLHRAQKVIQTCNEAGISTMLLKGIPMSLHYYKDIGVRPMGDVDILVPWEELEPAIEILKKFGNNPDPIEFKYKHLIHAVHCFDEGGIDIDLHWHAFFFQYYTDECVLKKSEFRQTFALTGSDQTFILSDSFQLFHTIIHGTIGGIPSIRWIPDAFTILKTSNSIDFKAIIKYAEERNVQFALHVGLLFLSNQFGFDFIVPELNNQSKTQKLYLKLSIKKPENLLSFAVIGVARNILTYYLFIKNASNSYRLGQWISQKIVFRYKMRS